MESEVWLKFKILAAGPLKIYHLKYFFSSGPPGYALHPPKLIPNQCDYFKYVFLKLERRRRVPLLSLPQLLTWPERVVIVKILLH
jgi:hypothetical protein